MNGFATTPPVRESFDADTIDGKRIQKIKLVYGEDGTAEDVTRFVGLHVTDFTLHEILGQLLMEIRLTNLLLNRSIGEDLTIEDLDDI